MSTRLTSTRRLAALLLVTTAGIGLAGCAGIATSPSAALQQQIEAARTPADHEALAAYYVDKALSARASAEEHRRMEKTYQGSPPGGRGGGSIAAHCNAIAGGYQDIATRFDAMAAEHRLLAGQAKP